GALLGLGAARRAGSMHGVEDAALHRLEPVTHVGQSPADDDGHRVLHVGGLHLLLEVASQNSAARVVCQWLLLVSSQDYDRVVPAESETVRDCFAHILA